MRRQRIQEIPEIWCDLTTGLSDDDHQELLRVISKLLAKQKAEKEMQRRNRERATQHLEAKGGVRLNKLCPSRVIGWLKRLWFDLNLILS